MVTNTSLKHFQNDFIVYGHPRDIYYYYSVNENGLKEMEKYLGIKIKILR